MLNAYQYDKNTTRAILLSFLYAKGDPDSNHDIIHYLSSLNQYITIFEKKVEVQKKDGLTIKEVLKNYFARLFKEKKTDYEQFWKRTDCSCNRKFWGSDQCHSHY
jgi:hypothetical protein